MDDSYQKYLFTNQEPIYQIQRNKNNFENNMNSREFLTSKDQFSQNSYQEDKNDINNQSESEFDEEYNRNLLKSQIYFIRDQLVLMGLPMIGDLFSSSLIEVETTLKWQTIYSLKKIIKNLFTLLQQRKKDFDFKNDIHDRLQQLENERNFLKQNYERIAQMKKNLENEVHNLQNKLKIQEKVNKEQSQKIFQEKEELQKNYTKIQNMKAQYEHEIKQRDLNYQKIQEHLKKITVTKLSNFKNSFEIIEQVEQNGQKFLNNLDFSQATISQMIDINKRQQG